MDLVEVMRKSNLLWILLLVNYSAAIIRGGLHSVKAEPKIAVGFRSLRGQTYLHEHQRPGSAFHEHACPTAATTFNKCEDYPL
jgi:hypothetical protein